MRGSRAGIRAGCPPVRVAADLAENYARFPKEFGFIKQEPIDGEESHVLQGEVAGAP